ncbi:hypothetical protein [Levilactobacillus humaensis]|uniref:hypothetical protein n=1 Tax=Levilactobacillus humaensis TaxID=2950375 RepID=UPI0021C39D82|nr:hypothetical protein [Levilactobacillus humaensis]
MAASKSKKDGDGARSKRFLMTLIPPITGEFGNFMKMKWLGPAFKGLSSLSEQSQLRGMTIILVAVVFAGILVIALKLLV